MSTVPNPEIKMKKCLDPDCGQEIAETEKVCPKCGEDFEQVEEELKRLSKLNKIADSRKPAPAPAPNPPAKKKKGLFSSLASKKGNK